MAIEYDTVLRMFKDLEDDYRSRHEEHTKLRNYFKGLYWRDVDAQSHGIASIFRDITQKRSDVGPDIKLVRNTLKDVTVKYQSYLTSLPMIRTFADRPESRTARNQADLKERVLYGSWAEAEMVRDMNKIAWYGPLMGDCFHGIWPDFENKRVTSFVRSPEYAYPVMGMNNEPDAYIFAWYWPTKQAMRAFPNWQPSMNTPQYSNPNKSSKDKTVLILEYSDSNEFVRWCDGDKVNGVEHDLNFNLFEQVPFIQIPDEPWNLSAVEQAVGLVEAGNALYSLVMQAMLENVFPRLVLENPMKFSETIDTGPGAVIPVNEGGKAYFLTPPAVGVSEGMNMLAQNEASVKQDTSMPDVNFGQFNASIITGKAINELQGAGTGSVVEMVQGCGIGYSLSKWNEKALTIYQRMFRDDKINLFGVRPRSVSDLRPEQFSLNFKGSQIVGSPRNEVIFSPYIDQHGKLVMGLQGLGAGLFSKRYVRDQVGVPDSDEMDEEIVGEALDTAIIGAIIQELQADPTPETGQKVAGEVAQYFGDTSLPHGPPHPLIAGPGSMVQSQGNGPQAGPPGAPPQGPQPGASGGPGPAATPTGPPAGQATGQPTQAPAAAQGQAQPVTLNEAVAAFGGVQGIVGRVFLVGEIVVRQQTAGNIETALTDGADRQTLTQGLPQYQGRLMFHEVPNTPSERYIEVTPGKMARPGGQEQASPEQLRRVFQQ